MLKWINKKRNKKGFTLVELVVVIAILGVLAAIAVPKLGGFRKNAALAADKATAATIVKAAELYNATAKENEKFAETADSDDMIAALVKADLIDGDLKPQQEGEFYLEYVNGVFRVKYDNENGQELYPKYDEDWEEQSGGN